MTALKWIAGSIALPLALWSLDLGGGIWAQTTEGRTLELTVPPIVWFERGPMTMGASEADLLYAESLCQRELGLPAPMGPLGVCAAQRFYQELPRRRVWTDRFGMERFEVTNARWRGCVIRGRCPPARVAPTDPRLSAPRMPVVGITSIEAEAFCAAVGGRLPTEREWERAARGVDGRRRFPWGRLYNPRRANHGRHPEGPDDRDGFSFAAPVGSFPSGASPEGIDDLAGNVWEWTRSAPRADEVGSVADASSFRIIRGGSWMQPAPILRVTHRVWAPTTAHRTDLGFRCAYDPPR